MLEELFSPESLSRNVEVAELTELQKDAIATILPEDFSPAELTSELTETIVSHFDFNIECLRSGNAVPVNLSCMKDSSPSWNGFLSQLSPEYLEAPSDKVQWTEIGELLTGYEELRVENWKNLSTEERIEVLQDIENQIALIEHRTPCIIKVAKMDSDTYGYFLENDGITLNATRVRYSGESQESLDRLLETLVHEGRHAYQYYNISTRVVHSSPAQVAQWKENWPIYANGRMIEVGGVMVKAPFFLRETGFRLYYYQPVETDARVFAADTIGYYRTHRNY